jgi:hypothetical protein
MKERNAQLADRGSDFQLDATLRARMSQRQLEIEGESATEATL